MQCGGKVIIMGVIQTVQEVAGPALQCGARVLMMADF